MATYNIYINNSTDIDEETTSTLSNILQENHDCSTAATNIVLKHLNSSDDKVKQSFDDIIIHLNKNKLCIKYKFPNTSYSSVPNFYKKFCEYTQNNMGSRIQWDENGYTGTAYLNDLLSYNETFYNDPDNHVSGSGVTFRDKIAPIIYYDTEEVNQNFNTAETQSKTQKFIGSGVWKPKTEGDGNPASNANTTSYNILNATGDFQSLGSVIDYFNGHKVKRVQNYINKDYNAKYPYINATDMNNYGETIKNHKIEYSYWKM